MPELTKLRSAMSARNQCGLCDEHLRSSQTQYSLKSLEHFNIRERPQCARHTVQSIGHVCTAIVQKMLSPECNDRQSITYNHVHFQIDFSPQRRIQLLDIGPCKNCSDLITAVCAIFTSSECAFRCTAAYTIAGTSDRPKVLRRLQFDFSMGVTSKFSPQRRTILGFHIGPSKSAPKTTVFEHFHFQMCVSPQRRAIFRHQNRQKCSEDPSCFAHFHLQMCFFATAARQFFNSRTYKSGPNTYSFLTFSLPNVLFATAACNFATGELSKKCSGHCRVFVHFHFRKCAFRHSVVHFLDI